MRPTFEITIRPHLESDVYPVIAELSLHSGAGAELELPTRSEGRLTLSAVDMQELEAKTNALDYGAFLGNALFGGEILRAFDRAVSQSGGNMNVLVSVEAPELRILHWEWLCIPVDHGFRFIAQDQRFPYCLFLPSQVDRHFPPFGRRDLSMLAVVASPGGLDKYHLEPFDEKRALEIVLDALDEQVHCDVLASREDLPGRLGPPSLSALCERLTAERYTLLHIIAHGRLNHEGETVIYLSNDTGEVQAVPATELLARLSQLATLPHFIFLAVCESARPEAEAALGGLGQRLVRELGVPAVLAMTRRVSYFLAYELAQRLYPRLLEHGEIERALVEACAGLVGKDDVLVPALYSRLAGRPLFSDELDGRELTPTEVCFGLDRLLSLFAERAPVLMPRLLVLVNQARAELGLSPRVPAKPDRSLAAAAKFHREALIGEEAPAQRHLHKNQEALPKAAERAPLSDAANREQQTRAEIESLSLRVLDMTFAAVALDKKPPAAPGPCPFPGMRAFGLNERRYFFGRDGLVEALLRRIKERSFLAVLGASGSGKSSVIRAGLLPRLLGDNPALKVITIIPGTDPPSQLAAELARAGLSEGRADNHQAILFVDQFEEVFTLCPVEKRSLFLQRLLALQQAIPVVLTMRADFWGECAGHPALCRLMQEHQELVAHMTEHELRGAIEQQARAGGLRFDPGLCEKIVADVQSEPGAMPLLQHALLKLWERRHGPWLSAAEYEALGGVQRAIADTADCIYNALSAEDRARLRTVFVRLVRIDDTAPIGELRRATRQRVAPGDLIPAGADSAPYQALIAHLIDARLLVTSTNPSTGQEEVEVIHEALTRNWPRLGGWLEEQRDSLTLREALDKAAHAWRAHQGDRQWLVHAGARLRECDELAARFPGVFNHAEQEYLSACRAKVWRTRLLWGALLILFLSCIGSLSRLALGTWREQQRRGSKLLVEQQARGWAEGRQAGTLATLLALEPGVRLRSLDQGLVAVAPFYKQRTVPPAEALAGLRDGLTVAAFARPIIAAHAGAVTAMALSANGTILASAGRDGQLRLFDAHSGAFLQRVRTAPAAPTAVLFAPAADNLYVAAADGTVRVYDRRGALVRTLDELGEAVTTLALAADGRWLAAGSARGRVRLYELSPAERRLDLIGAPHDLLALAFTADGQRLAGGAEDGTLQLWDVRAPHAKPRLIRAHRGAVHALVALPRSTTVISGGGDRMVRMWNVTDGEPIGDSLTVGAPVSALAVSPQQVLAVGDREGNTTAWLLGVRAPLWEVEDDARGRAAAAISGLAFLPEPGRLAVAATDGVVRVWNVPRMLIVSHLPDHGGPVTAADFSPERGYFLTAASDRSLRIYRLPDGQLVQEIASLDAPVIAAAFAPAEQVTVLTRAGTVTRYLESNGALVVRQSLPIANLAVAQIDRSARRAVIAAGSQVQVWDLLSGQLVQRFAQPQAVQAVAVSPGGQLLATASADQRIRIFDTASATLRRTLAAPGGAVLALAFSADGRRLLSSGLEQRPRLWELATGHVSELPIDNSHKQVAVALSASGKRAIVATAPGLITVWDLGRMQPLLFLRTRHPLLRSAALSTDGRYVLSGGHDGAARLFAIEPALLWKLGCQTLSGSVRPEDDTPESWAQARAACASMGVPSLPDSDADMNQL